MAYQPRFAYDMYCLQLVLRMCCAVLDYAARHHQLIGVAWTEVDARAVKKSAEVERSKLGLDTLLEIYKNKASSKQNSIMLTRRKGRKLSCAAPSYVLTADGTHTGCMCTGGLESTPRSGMYRKCIYWGGYPADEYYSSTLMIISIVISRLAPWLRWNDDAS